MSGVGWSGRDPGDDPVRVAGWRVGSLLRRLPHQERLRTPRPMDRDTGTRARAHRRGRTRPPRIGPARQAPLHRRVARSRTSRPHRQEREHHQGSRRLRRHVLRTEVAVGALGAHRRRRVRRVPRPRRRRSDRDDRDTRLDHPHPLERDTVPPRNPRTHDRRVPSVDEPSRRPTTAHPRRHLVQGPDRRRPLVRTRRSSAEATPAGLRLLLPIGPAPS